MKVEPGASTLPLVTSATKALPLIINMLHDSNYYGSAALREALVPVIGDSVGQ